MDIKLTPVLTGNDIQLNEVYVASVAQLDVYLYPTSSDVVLYSTRVQQRFIFVDELASSEEISDVSIAQTASAASINTLEFVPSIDVTGSASLSSIASLESVSDIDVQANLPVIDLDSVNSLEDVPDINVIRSIGLSSVGTQEAVGSYALSRVSSPSSVASVEAVSSISVALAISAQSVETSEQISSFSVTQRFSPSTIDDEIVSDIHIGGPPAPKTLIPQTVFSEQQVPPFVLDSSVRRFSVISVNTEEQVPPIQCAARSIVAPITIYSEEICSLLVVEEV